MKKMKFLLSNLKNPAKVKNSYVKIIYFTSPISLFFLLGFTLILFIFRFRYGYLYTTNITSIFWSKDYFLYHRFFSALIFILVPFVIIPTYSSLVGEHKSYNNLFVTNYQTLIIGLIFILPFLFLGLNFWTLPGFMILLSSHGYLSLSIAFLAILTGPIAAFITITGTTIAVILKPVLSDDRTSKIDRFTYLRPRSSPIINLDVGAFSPRLKPVEDNLKNWHSLVNKSAPTSKLIWQYSRGEIDHLPPKWLKKTVGLAWTGVKDLRSAIADLIKADRQNIIFVSSTTRAIQIAIETLSPKDKNIVTTNFEHPTEKRLLETTKIKYGVEIFTVEVKSQDDLLSNWEEKFIERFVSTCIEKKASIVLISHVCYGNGLILPIEKICLELSTLPERINIIIDGAHAVGNIDVDLSKIKSFSFYAFGGHKWLFSSINIGILVASDDIMSSDNTKYLLTHEIHESLAVNEDRLKNDGMSSSINLDAMVALASSLKYLSLVRFEVINKNMKSLKKNMIRIAANHDDFKILEKDDIGIPNDSFSPGIINIQSKNGFLSYDELKKIEKILECKYNIIVNAIDLVGFYPVIRLCLPFYLLDSEVKRSLHAVNEVFCELKKSNNSR
jgi:selenocysteine lyase/cysteine desulfurase